MEVRSIGVFARAPEAALVRRPLVAVTCRLLQHVRAGAVWVNMQRKRHGLVSSVSMTAWHPVARSNELRAGENIVTARVQGQDLALWRARSGAAQAWEDRCPHRSVRLSLGQVVGDSVSCAYHGWQYAAGSGRCAAVPANPAMPPPASVCVRAFALAEAAGMVWVSLHGLDRQPETSLSGGWNWCRTLSLRAGAERVRESLAGTGWREAGCAWQGLLGGERAAAFLLDASEALSVLHVWTGADSGSSGMKAAHAAARRLRTQLESMRG